MARLPFGLLDECASHVDGSKIRVEIISATDSSIIEQHICTSHDEAAAMIKYLSRNLREYPECVIRVWEAN